MANTQGFKGFPKQAVSFFRELTRHNEKTWFAAHKSEYEEQVLTPAKDFVVALGDKLRPIAPGVTADPRVNRSLFRIYRDARFSRDKSPYKTHLGIWLWEGPRPRMENSGFYFQLEPPELYLGVGMYRFPDDLLPAFRQDAAHPVHGLALADAVKTVQKAGFEVGGSKYKRTPRGLDPEHPNAELFKHDGLWAGANLKLPPELHTPKLVDTCYKIYRRMLPLHQWLAAFVERNL